jgi:hypothetical protein
MQRRRSLINNTVLFYAIMLVVFTAPVLFLIYLFLFRYTASELALTIPDATQNEFNGIKYLVLTYVFILGIFCFYLGHLYSHTKFLGIFRRITKDCQDIAQNRKDAHLIFRKHDRFNFFADEFNRMIRALRSGRSSESGEKSGKKD